MSNSENGPKGGFLRRLFQRSEPNAAPPARNGAGEIVMVPMPDASTTGKRLPKTKSVLVVAPLDATVKRWKRDMEGAGYGVEVAENGAKGLDILYGFSFDALLIDHAEPEVDALDMLHQIRSQDELKNLFIGVFVHDKAGRVNQEMETLDAGANRVFQRAEVKPEEILTALKTALFPRVLSAQPRTKQSPAAPAPAEERPATVSISALDGAPSSPAPETPATAVAPPRTISMGAATAPTVPRVNKKVLIIDADESVVSIYRQQIEAAGYEVEVALDGETGFHDIYAQIPTRCCSTCSFRVACRVRKFSRKRARRKSSRNSRCWCSPTSTPATWRRKPRRRASCVSSTRRRPRRATWWRHSTRSSCPARRFSAAGRRSR